MRIKHIADHEHPKCSTWWAYHGGRECQTLFIRFEMPCPNGHGTCYVGCEMEPSQVIEIFGRAQEEAKRVEYIKRMERQA